MNSTDLTLSIDQSTLLQSINRERTTEFLSLIDGSRPYLRKWLTWLDTTRNKHELENFFDFARKDLEEKRSYVMWILHSQRIVGIIHLRNIGRTNRKAMIGYWVGQEYRGRSFAKKATRNLAYVDQKSQLLSSWYRTLVISSKAVKWAMALSTPFL